MPKNKKSSDSDSESGQDTQTVSKRSKRQNDDEGENVWSLGKHRYVKLREYKGKNYVDIREFYDAGGEMKPGKKGISLSFDQWSKIKGIMDEVDEAITKIRKE